MQWLLVLTLLGAVQNVSYKGDKANLSGGVKSSSPETAIEVTTKAFIGDTIRFSIGGVQISAVIQSIVGDTITVDGIIVTNNVLNIRIDDMKISLSAFIQGRITVYSFGNVYANGGNINLNGVIIRNVRITFNQSGFYGYGDVAFGDRTLTLLLQIDSLNNLVAHATYSQITVYNVTLTNLFLHIENGMITGGADVNLLGNTFHLNIGFDGNELYAESYGNTFIYRELTISDFYLLVSSSSGFYGKGKIALYDSYADVELNISSNSYIQVSDGHFVIRGIEVNDFYGYIGNGTYQIRGRINLYGSELTVAVYYDTNLPEPELRLSVVSSEVVVGSVRIYDLTLFISKTAGLYGSGYVYFNNINYPANGKVKVTFSTDWSGNIFIGIENGYVVLNNGATISNLTAYISNSGFFGYGTYRQGNSDVTVVFKSSNGTVSWRIYGDAIVFGNILLRHYYVGSDGRAYAWWIISPDDSLYFEINWAQRFARVVYPGTFMYGNVMVYNLTGTIYADSGFIGQGYVRIGDQNNYVEIPIQFRSNPNGKLYGVLPNYLSLPDGQGITVNIYGINVTITEDGITGYGQVNLENISFYVEFTALYNGYIDATVRDGYINLGNIVIKEINIHLYPFTASGFVYIPEFQGGIYVVLKANGSGGLSFYVPGFDFYVNGFHIYGNFQYVSGSLFFQGGVEIPGGGAGSVDYLYATSRGIDSCSITLRNIYINGFRIVYANGRFASNPGRIILSGNFDLSNLSGYIGVNNIYFNNLMISSDGRFLGCELVGVQNFHIGDFFAFSGEFGFFENYMVIYYAQIDFSNLSNVNGRVRFENIAISYDGHIVYASAIGLEYLNVGVFHASGWLYFVNSGVSLTGRVELDNIGYAYVKELLLDSHGNILGLTEAGCSFTIGGYGFTGTLSFPANNRIYFEGSVHLPIFISGDATGSILLERTPNGQGGVLGTGYNVLAGSLSIPDFMMGGYHFLGGSFAFDSVGVAGRARISVPEVCEVELRLSFNWDGTFNYAYLAATGMNIPIGSTGLFINGLGGGVYHFTTPYEYWMFTLWGLVSDPVRVLALDATIEITTDGRVSGLGHLMVAQYTWASAGFDVYTRLGYLDAYGWLGEDPSVGISFWGCYIRGQDSVYYNWINVDAWGRGNLSISVWFVRLDAWFGFAYDLSTWPFVYGPYWRQRLYNSGIGASGLAFDYLAGINVTWNPARRRFDYDVWWGPVDQQNPGNAPFVSDMVFVGPYPDMGLDYDYLGGEPYIRPYDTYEVPGGYTWVNLGADNSGYFDFNYFGNSGIVYLGLYINSTAAQTVYLRYGIAGEFKLFEDGNVAVYGNNGYAQPDQYSYALNFSEPGWKFVMFKVRKLYDQWGLYLRVTDANGNIIDGVSYQPNRPDQVVVYHDRGLSWDFFRFDRQNNASVEGGKFVLRAEGRPLRQTYMKDKTHYPRIDFPSFKVNFMLNGVARNDSTLILMTDSTLQRYYGVLFYYPSKGDEVVGEILGAGEKTGVKTSFYVGRWYTLEFVFEPESLYLYTYEFSRSRPIRPLFSFKLDGDWNPAFYASVGGNDNVLYLDNYVVRHDWQTTMLNIETPHPYPNNARLTWTIEDTSASFIRLHFENFSTDYWDSLYIKDQYGRVWYTYNGPNLGSFSTPPIPSKKVILEFHSDASVRDYGFKVDYVRSRKDVPYFYSTPMYIATPSPVPNNWDHTYTINIPDAKAIKVCFSNFNMSITDSISADSVILYDGNGNRYGAYTGNLGTFFAIAIPGNTVNIRVKTDNVVQSQGFRVPYVSYVTNDYTGVNDRPVTFKPAESDIVKGDILKLSISSVGGNVKAVIYDVLGRSVTSRSYYVSRETSSLDVNISDLPAGVFFVRVYDENGNEIVAKKFLKVR